MVKFFYPSFTFIFSQLIIFECKFLMEDKLLYYSLNRILEVFLKQIGKIKDSDEREREAKDLEKKAKKMGFGRAEIEKILDNQGAYGEEYAMKKTMEEAEKMHSYMNTLSFERTANIWSEAAKKDEDLDPVKGSKTLTKKTQEKITINPMEKEASRK